MSRTIITLAAALLASACAPLNIEFGWNQQDGDGTWDSSYDYDYDGSGCAAAADCWADFDNWDEECVKWHVQADEARTDLKEIEDDITRVEGVLETCEIQGYDCTCYVEEIEDYEGQWDDMMGQLQDAEADVAYYCGVADDIERECEAVEERNGC